MADDRSAEVRFISGIFFAIALIIVSLRCYGRLVIIKRFWWDDFLSILALVCLTISLLPPPPLEFQCKSV